MKNTKIYKNDFNQKTYAELASWCSSNNYMIVDRGEYYEAEQVALTQADNDKLRKAEIKTRLSALSEDIVQEQAGEIVPNIADKKQEFITLHNELRVLEGKVPRENNN